MRIWWVDMIALPLRTIAHGGYGFKPEQNRTKSMNSLKHGTSNSCNAISVQQHLITCLAWLSHGLIGSSAMPILVEDILVLTCLLPLGAPAPLAVIALAALLWALTEEKVTDDRRGGVACPSCEGQGRNLHDVNVKLGMLENTCKILQICFSEKHVFEKVSDTFEIFWSL